MTLDDGAESARADGPDAPEPHAGRRDFEAAASLAAHEMAGPLSTATAAIDLLRLRLDDADDVTSELFATASRHLRIARLQTARLAQLATGPRDPQRSRTDLAALSREMVNDLALAELGDHPTTVESPGSIEASVDPDQVRQVLYNLLTNAANYSPPGRAIVVELSRDEHAVELRVRDQGHGVAPEAADRIFEPYQREHAEAPGLGLGLSLSRDIARKHHGDLTLEPAPRGGAVFLLTLPRDTARPT